ncbi:hypothetical protein HAX54_038415, partial [Datura stramonium]|nr:hypothetical protein [Datura stramonium]
ATVGCCAVMPPSAARVPVQSVRERRLRDAAPGVPASLFVWPPVHSTRYSCSHPQSLPSGVLYAIILNIHAHISEIYY